MRPGGSGMSLCGHCERFFCVLLAMFVVSLAAFLRGRVVALGRRFMFLGSCVVCFNDMVFFGHGILRKSSYPEDPGLTGLMQVAGHRIPHHESTPSISHDPKVARTSVGGFFIARCTQHFPVTFRWSKPRPTQSEGECAWDRNCSIAWCQSSSADPSGQPRSSQSRCANAAISLCPNAFTPCPTVAPCDDTYAACECSSACLDCSCPDKWSLSECSSATKCACAANSCISAARRWFS